MRITTILAAIALSANSLICQNRAEEKGSHPANKVAYLQAGEVWISTVEGLDKNQITATAGKVEDFVFSGDLKYLAYSKILKYVDEPGIFEDGEEVPQRALCSVVVQDLRNRKVLWEVIPKDDWIYPERWLPGGKLLCYESSGFDVAGFFEWDAVKGSRKEVDHEEANHLWEADYSPDESFMLYVDAFGLGASYRMNLHLVNLKSSEDRILFSHKTIYDAVWSRDRKNIAFIEISQGNGKSQDTFWVYHIEEKTLTRYFTIQSRAKSAGNKAVAWSPDDRFVSFFLAPEALVFAFENPATMYRIGGGEFCWGSNTKIVYVSGEDLYVYDLQKGKASLFLKQAARPRLLK